jgi:hypothetical protein
MYGVVADISKPVGFITEPVLGLLQDQFFGPPLM